jgi:hypothetical protein
MTAPDPARASSAARASECARARCRRAGACMDPDNCRVSCRGGKDGECIWEKCPQLRDGEPDRSGRHCPMDKHEDQEWWVDR